MTMEMPAEVLIPYCGIRVEAGDWPGVESHSAWPRVGCGLSLASLCHLHFLICKQRNNNGINLKGYFCIRENQMSKCSLQ